MRIEKRIKYYLQSFTVTKDGKKVKSDESQIRMRVLWDDNVLQMNVGHSVKPANWNSKAYSGKNGKIAPLKTEEKAPLKLSV